MDSKEFHALSADLTQRAEQRDRDNASNKADTIRLQQASEAIKTLANRIDEVLRRIAPYEPHEGTKDCLFNAAMIGRILRGENAERQ